MGFKAVLFDLDGTLLNTLPDLHYITNATLRQFGYPERSMDEVRMYIGNGVKLLISRALPDRAALSDEEFDVILQAMRQNYLKYQNRLTEKYEGIDELLRNLREHGVKTAIVSNKMDAAVQEVMAVYFDGLLDYGIGQRDDLRTKPHPDLCNEALRVLGVEARDCIYVGDSDTDIETGNNAGMLSLSVTWGFRDREFLRQSGALHFVNRPSDIMNYILYTETL